MERTRACHQRFVEPTPDVHRAKQGGNRGAMLPSSTIGLPLQPEASWHLFRAFRFQVIQHPGHHPATNFLEQGAQFALKRRHLLRRRFLVKEVIDESGAMRQRTRELHDEGP